MQNDGLLLVLIWLSGYFVGVVTGWLMPRAGQSFRKAVARWFRVIGGWFDKYD